MIAAYKSVGSVLAMMVGSPAAPVPLSHGKIITKLVISLFEKGEERVTHFAGRPLTCSQRHCRLVVVIGVYNLDMVTGEFGSSSLV